MRVTQLPPACKMTIWRKCQEGLASAVLGRETPLNRREWACQDSIANAFGGRYYFEAMDVGPILPLQS